MVVLPRPYMVLCCSGTIIVIRRKTLHCPPFKKYLWGERKRERNYSHGLP